MLSVSQLSKTYESRGGTRTKAIDTISFDLSAREFVSVVGPSGCGKTTLLKCIAGLLSPSGGQVAFEGRRVTAPLPDMAVVFQDYSRSLMPWFSVAQNVELPLKGRHGSAERRRLVGEAVAAVGLTGFEEHHPWQLSGGMQQRAAIARALAFQPRVLLLDEPMASVDAQTRNELEDLLLRLHADYDITVLLVTHDIDESIYMADRVIVLTPSPTEVRQVVTVGLERPRDQVGTKSTQLFTELRRTVYDLVTPSSVSSITDAELARHEA